jgi:hypothetical protein
MPPDKHWPRSRLVPSWAAVAETRPSGGQDDMLGLRYGTVKLVPHSPEWANAFLLERVPRRGDVRRPLRVVTRKANMKVVLGWGE